jgi:hypothetical protein
MSLPAQGGKRLEKEIVIVTNPSRLSMVETQCFILV